MHNGAEGPQRINIKRLIHTIHAVTDIEACRARYLDLLGGIIFAEGYFEAEDRDMALLYVTDHMLEPMAARDPARQDKPFARYLQRYGQGFHSFEIAVENGPETAAQLKRAGCRLASEYGVFFFVREESTGGVLLEVTELPMPNDLHDRRGWRAGWSEGHPAGVTGLDHIACVTADMQAVLRFFTELCDGEIASDTRLALPQAARRVVLRLGETRVAFIQPEDTASGPLAGFLQPPSSGIYSLVWRVASESGARAHFHAKGVRTTGDGCVAGGFAIEPEDFLGARHEFVGG